jgi:hypothetical protein
LIVFFGAQLQGIAKKTAGIVRLFFFSLSGTGKITCRLLPLGLS